MRPSLGSRRPKAGTGRLAPLAARFGAGKISVAARAAPLLGAAVVVLASGFLYLSLFLAVERIDRADEALETRLGRALYALLGGPGADLSSLGGDLDYVSALLPRLGGVDSRVAIAEAAGRLAKSIAVYRAAVGDAASREGAGLASAIDRFLGVLHAREREIRASFNYLLLASGVGIAAVAVYAVWLWARLRESGLRDEWSRRSLRRALEAEDAARRRIARDLHDDAAQDIAAAKMLCDRAAACAAAGAEAGGAADTAVGVAADAARFAGEASALLRGAGLKLRSLAMDLRPPELERGSLVDALASLCSNARRGEPIGLSVGPDLPGIAPEAALHAYRVAQEGISNAAKHAPGHRIELRLERAMEGGRAWLLLEVRDRGAPEGGQGGPSAAAADPSLSSGTGLSIMRERAALAGGRLEFERRPDGASLRLRVPGLAPGKEGT